MEILPKNPPKKYPPKKILPKKIPPKNSSKQNPPKKNLPKKSSPKHPPKKILPKKSSKNIPQKKTKKNPKKFQTLSQKVPNFENIQFPTSHLEAENPFGLVLIFFPVKRCKTHRQK
jgi:hypothetical protein